MKILTINTRYIGGGGAAYIANTLHREINKIDGYSSTFLYGRGVDGDSNSKRIIYPKMDYISALSYRLFGKELNFNKDIEDEIKNCDIVHLHNVHGYYIDYIKLFKLLKKHNKKIIWTLHDMWPITGRCGYSFGCERWKEKCGDCKNKKSYPISMVDKSERELEIKKQVIGSIDKDNMTIVTPSKWLANMCKESYLNKFNIIDIPNGIEHKEVKLSKKELRDKYNLSLDEKVILFVAADTKDERKGIKYILDIIPNCPQYKFISIGKEIKDINYSNFVQLGYISDRNKINEIYSMADVFIIPSLDDNFPTTVLESFANSTPVVGFAQGGIPEQINENNGIVTKQIGSKELMYNIKLILESEGLDTYSYEARKSFEENYTLQMFLDKYLKIYN